MFRMPVCHEVARLIATGEMERRNPWGRFLVRLHLKSCDVCNQYARQLKNLTSLVRQKISRQVDVEQTRRRSERITRHLVKP